MEESSGKFNNPTIMLINIILVNIIIAWTSSIGRMNYAA